MTLALSEYYSKFRTCLSLVNIINQLLKIPTDCSWHWRCIQHLKDYWLFCADTRASETITPDILQEKIRASVDLLQLSLILFTGRPSVKILYIKLCGMYAVLYCSHLVSKCISVAYILEKKCPRTARTTTRIKIIRFYAIRSWKFAIYA